MIISPTYQFWSALLNQSSSLSNCHLSVQCRIFINPTLNIFAIHVWKIYITLNVIFYVICLFCFKSLTCNFKTSQIKLNDFIYCEVFFVIFYKLYFVIIFFPQGSGKSDTSKEPLPPGDLDPETYSGPVTGKENQKQSPFE